MFYFPKKISRKLKFFFRNADADADASADAEICKWSMLNISSLFILIIKDFKAVMRDV